MSRAAVSLTATVWGTGEEQEVTRVEASTARVDSIDSLDLFFSLEEELEIDLPDEEARNISTLRELVRSLRILVGEDETGGPDPPSGSST